MIDDLKYGLENFLVFAAVTVIPFLVIGMGIGFWVQELFFIGALWTLIAFFGAILKVSFEDRFDMIWPILLGLAWVPLWWPIHRLAVEKAGFSGAFLDKLGRLPPFIELPWWSSLSFRLSVLIVLIGSGYGISYLRSNR